MTARLPVILDANTLTTGSYRPGAVPALIAAAGIEQPTRPCGTDREATLGRAASPLLDWLVTGQVMAANPTGSVRGPAHVVKVVKTPVLAPDVVIGPGRAPGLSPGGRPFPTRCRSDPLRHTTAYFETDEDPEESGGRLYAPLHRRAATARKAATTSLR
jgi:hypothetical protein